MKHLLFLIVVFGIFSNFNLLAGQGSLYNIHIKNFNSSQVKNLTLGYDPYGSDGLDTALGESPLPPYGSQFDARFRLPEDTSITSYKDIRYGCGQPFRYNFNLEWENASQVILIGDSMGGSYMLMKIMIIDPSTGTQLKKFETYYNDTVYYIIPAVYNKIIVEVLYNGPLSWPSYYISSPNGGEAIQAGTNYTIYWAPQSWSPTLTLQFSPNGGLSWEQIAQVPGQYSSYPWQVPNISSNNCRILLGDYPCAYSMSAGSFIIYQGNPPVLQPVEIPFSFSNGTGSTKEIRIGLHPDATEYVDSTLGELIRPLLPVGNLDVLSRVKSAAGGEVLTVKELKKGYLGFTGTRHYEFAIRTSADSIINLDCSLPSGMSIRLGYFYSVPNGISPVDTMLGSGTIHYTFPKTTFFYTTGLSVGITCIFDGVTPVELNSFTAFADENVVKLFWSTASEKNNKGFDVQKRTSSQKEWNDIAFVKGNGTTTNLSDYFYSDNNLIPGEVYYRLKQIDYDGTAKITDEIKIFIKNPEHYQLKQNYPNSFNPSTAISYSLPTASNIKLIIYNTLGQTIKTLVSEYKTAGTYSINFNTSTLPSGIYFYKLEAGQFSQVKKMILLK